MNNRLKWLLLIIFSSIVLVIFASKLFIIEEHYRRPGNFGSYPVSGLYTFSPETIFESLDQGETDVFTSYFGNPDEIDLYYNPITWSQSDYLKIVSVLSQQIWGESLSSKDWNIESVYFAQDCKGNPVGFNVFDIVYYKDLGVTNWERNYATRLIDIEPWRGLAYWGENAIFSSTFLSRWKHIDLENFLISADDALQSAEEHGGNNTDKSDCSLISVSMYQNDNEMWDVNYFAADFRIRIDANSGKYKILNVGK